MTLYVKSVHYLYNSFIDPFEFLKMLKYIKNLDFKDKPDYQGLLKYIKKLAD